MARGYGITDSIPRDMRAHMDGMVHGCDLCQEACPRNQAKVKAKYPDDEFLRRIGRDFDLVRLLHLDDEFYRTRVRPIMYNYVVEKRFFQRNAAVALGNTKDPAFLPELRKELSHQDETVREHVVWAMGSIGGEDAVAMLREHGKTESSPLVMEELGIWLGGELVLLNSRVATGVMQHGV